MRIHAPKTSNSVPFAQFLAYAVKRQMEGIESPIRLYNLVRKYAASDASHIENAVPGTE